MIENDMMLSDFLSDLSLRSPEILVPSAWQEHAPFAFWLVDKLRPKMIVELGTHHGFSYFTFCQAIKMSGRSSKPFFTSSSGREIVSGAAKLLNSG